MGRAIARLIEKANHVISSPWAFVASIVVIALGFVFGPRVFGEDYKHDIHLVVAIFTFFTVFLLEHKEDRDIDAINVKLNELIAAAGKANNEKIGVEALSEEDVGKLADKERRTHQATSEGEVAQARKKAS